MDKPNQQGQSKTSSELTISVSLYQAPLLKSMVEKLAHRRYDHGFSKEIMPLGLKPVDTATIEAYVSGCMAIEENDECLSIAYTTCFAFTCTRVLGSGNVLSWVNSLS